MQRLYLIQKLDISKNIENVEVLVPRTGAFRPTSSTVCTLYGHLGEKDKNRLCRITNLAGKEQRHLGCMYKTQVKQKARRIASDPVHPLFNEFIKLPSGRCYRAAAATKNLYKKSFIPNAIISLNS